MIHPHHGLPAWQVWEQLKQRNVFRVAALYLAVSWLILEPVHVVFHMLDVPLWANRLVLLVMALGLAVTLIFSWVYEITPEGFKLTAEVPVGRSIRQSTRRRLDLAIIAVLAVALTYFVADKFWISRRVAPPLPTASETVAHGVDEHPQSADSFAPPPHSIAVLPFINLSGDKDQEYFSDGLTEELLNSLAGINNLRVAARTSAFSFKGRDNDIGLIGRKLNVATVLEGSVRRSANTLRVTAQLINTVTGFHLWSSTYDRQLGDVLKLQTEIATAVADALEVTLLDDVGARIERGGTHNGAALDAYMRGSQAYSIGSDAKAVEAAIAAYSEAIRLDPRYALAYAGRSNALNDYASEFATGPAIRNNFDRARVDARQAIALAPELPEGQLALGSFFEAGSLDFTEATKAHERALELAPGNAQILRESGRFAAYMGYFDKGLAATQRAVELDPLSPRVHSAYGDALYFARQYAGAIAAYTEAISLDPSYTADYGYVGLAYYGLGDLRAALASCDPRPNNWATQFCLSLVYEKLGRKADALSALAKMRSAMGDASAYQYASIYAQWGMPKKALLWLETAMRLRDPGLVQLKTDPLMDPLRNEPRFQEVVRQLRFPD